MLHVQHLFDLITLNLIVATPQINLYYTDRVREITRDHIHQYDCLRVPIFVDETNLSRQIISYCMNELSTEFSIENNIMFPKFTFLELSKQNITSEQLYFWSAPIDIIEHYQFYLNQLATFKDTNMAKQIFYNCTLPRFGSLCQYELDSYRSNYSYLYEIIDDYYSTYDYNPTNFTCYTHLQCNRGPDPSCLDWTEVCNGQIECLDGGVDEEYCWELEVNECNDDEYRCMNGQCILKSFFRDDKNTPDCLDGSDEIPATINVCNTNKASIGCEDITCRYSVLTSSCVFRRSSLLVQAMYSNKDESISSACWAAVKCVTFVSDSEKLFCLNLCNKQRCVHIINETCPDMFYAPQVPVLFGEIYLAHKKTDFTSSIRGGFASPFICCNNSDYTKSFINMSKVLFNGTSCYRRNHRPSELISLNSWDLKYMTPLKRMYQDLKRYMLLTNYTSSICNRQNMYQCSGSVKCIHVTRLMDNIFDCPEKDDETITPTQSGNLKLKQKSHFRCIMLDKYIHQSFVQDGHCHCQNVAYDFCEDEDLDIARARKIVSFQTICDGFIELIPIIIEGSNETDETHCEQWFCNNMYTHCDGLWNCPNGEDEVGCYFLPTLNCSLDHHLCVSPATNELACLSTDKANDGNIDCVGATDEPKLCQKNYQAQLFTNFYCVRLKKSSCISPQYICDGINNCNYGDDEIFCVRNLTGSIVHRWVCNPPFLYLGSDVEKFICQETQRKVKQHIKYFSLNRKIESLPNQITAIEHPVTFTSSSHAIIPNHKKLQCHRGIHLRVWINRHNSSSTDTCLCPPSFYGHQCQYQNQRISLTVKFRALSDSWSTLFAIIISLIDNAEQRTIHSSEQLTYLSARDCNVKFNIYLLYATRPKNQANNYAIHIDIYEKLSLNYRGSILLPIIFQFLPVYRIAKVLDIPKYIENVQSCSNLQCIHGKCIFYSNYPRNISFCQCDEEWSGKYCTIRHTCTCASDSICIGIASNNRSICVCPIHKFGPRCFLTDPICQMNHSSNCFNGGQCITADEYSVSNRKFHCVCPKGYSGDRCEINDNKMVLSFGKNIAVSQSLFIHFIEVVTNSTPKRTTTLRAIPLAHDSFDIYWSQPFHLIFIELYYKTYYLASIQTNYERSKTIIKTIHPRDRCQHINELFNETFAQLHLIRRIKYYHLSCQNYSLNVSCFYDDIHLCLCYDYGQRRLANCFEFDHNMVFDCSGQSVCENGGQCFEDSPDCPKRSICICRPCFYGARCQFSTRGFGLSLDGILGYHIRPNANLYNQSPIVKISLVLTVIFMIAGLMNGMLALMTFNNKIICEVGCGIYLLGSSITTLCITVLFGLKFWILIFAQMNNITNRLFLNIQCRSLDFMLRVCVNMDQWLNACVAMERSYTVIKGIRFQKEKSKKIAQRVIIVLLTFIIGTSIHDVAYRRLIDEENESEKRIWCIVTYSSHLQVFNFIINIFHFTLPFVINLISAIILIGKKSRQQSNLQRNRRFIELLRKQIKQHKHLFTAPVLLVILALPRLIISIVSKCMKSINDPWLYLMGYFISYIPPMLTFILFILPSKFYKSQFHKNLVAYRTRIQHSFQSIM